MGGVCVHLQLQQAHRTSSKHRQSFAYGAGRCWLVFPLMGSVCTEGGAQLQKALGARNSTAVLPVLQGFVPDETTSLLMGGSAPLMIWQCSKHGLPAVQDGAGRDQIPSHGWCVRGGCAAAGG